MFPEVIRFGDIEINRGPVTYKVKMSKLESLLQQDMFSRYPGQLTGISLHYDNDEDHCIYMSVDLTDDDEITYILEEDSYYAGSIEDFISDAIGFKVVAHEIYSDTVWLYVSGESINSSGSDQED